MGRFPFPIAYPAVLGHESIGQVIETGTQVRYLQPGDLVTRVGTPPVGGVHAAWGGFAEIGIATDHRAMREDGLPEQAWQPYRIHQVIPEGVDARGAPMIITWRETLSYLRRAGARRGTRLLVIGSGANGIAFAAHAKNLGATEVALIGSAQRKQIARRVGVTAYYDYNSEGLDAVLTAAHPSGFELVIDAVGRRGTLNLGLGHLQPGGTVGVYGLDEWGKLTINPAQATGTFTYYHGGYDEAEVHDDVVSMMQAGLLDPWLWLPSGEPLPLAELPQAFSGPTDPLILKALVQLSDALPVVG
jgi:L-iditol 2-dehydrogenase